ncbi:hypothetical protein BDN70DRAFT_813981 [Pholiota conissans]|uniref:RING-type domain-containing protein n=1 Tax=Pholiota conissans TaxID=109636 RepID=A0A9P5YTL0_9AGAR|nr:hypothetical protein BDN70DRAFT_813981 [Pholiota conissans]
MYLLTTIPLLCLAAPALSYIPASPTNSTQDAIAGGLNVTDISQLYMQWYSNGSYAMHVSYQLAGYNSTGVSKGVLVHFSEERASNFTPPTSTPWIALVSCDKNATNASIDEDIFTLARDMGAVSALLYSLSSVACVINPSYSDPTTFDHVFDIFSSQSSTSSHVIEYQFSQLTPQNQSLFAYDSGKLNQSFSDIERSIDTGIPVSAGYLLAVLRAYNATDNMTMTPISNTDTTTDQASGSKPPNTALAMIILYAITGCVSALFCIVIISGAIRAIRHPERYGPRTRIGEDGGPPQSRARGLTRAILDTFPIVKFGTQTTSDPTVSSLQREKGPNTHDPEADLEMNNLSSIKKISPHTSLPELTPNHSSTSGLGAFVLTQPTPNIHSPGNDTHAIFILHSQSRRGSHRPVENQQESADMGEGPSRPNPSAAIHLEHEDMVPASIGRETCPICIVDFEEGDDIRVLPCEGKHCFHQECVDPWLLKLSSSCPICRHDFLALENMLSGQPDDHDGVEPTIDSHPAYLHEHANGGRFSRYLRFARRRRRGDETDPTDPYMPTAPDTPMYSGI